MNQDNTAAATAAGLVLRREIRVEWGDCDPAQIVFYPRYLAFFDASTAYLFEAVRRMSRTRWKYAVRPWLYGSGGYNRQA